MSEKDQNVMTNGFCKTIQLMWCTTGFYFRTTIISILTIFIIVYNIFSTTQFCLHIMCQ